MDSKYAFETESMKRCLDHENELMRQLLDSTERANSQVKIKQKCQACGNVFDPQGTSKRVCPDCIAKLKTCLERCCN